MSGESRSKAPAALDPSTLYLVGTPIGNLEDISARALRTLGECDVVAAEDTRRAGMLLQRFGLRKPLVSYHRFNEARRGEEILNRLARGERVALITDAGVPGISDPGQRVVAAAVAAGFRVEAVPGPCAFVTALTASGLPTDEVHFVGFLPHKSGQRRRELERLRALPGTLALYESPYRIVRLLEELSDVMPDRAMVIARELTKRFEENVRGTPRSILERVRGRAWKGEITVIIGPSGVEASPETVSAAEVGTVDECAAEPDVAKSVVHLALAQMRVEPGDVASNLSRAQAMIFAGRKAGADVVLLPEVLDCGWTHPSARRMAGEIPGGEACERLRQAAIDAGVFVCGGLAERDGDRLFNAAVLINPEGQILLHHRKIHEIPFARALYSKGDRLGVAETPLGRLGVMICADALAPELSVTRCLGAMGAELILSPCAWAVPRDHDVGQTSYGELWVDHYAPAARENGAWIAGCSNVGPILEGDWQGWRCIGNSLVIRPDGTPAHWCRHGDQAEELVLVEVVRRG